MAKATTKKQTTSEIMLQYARALAAANDCIARLERIIAQQDDIIALGKTHFEELYRLSVDNLKELTLSFAKGQSKEAEAKRKLENVAGLYASILAAGRGKGAQRNKENAKQGQEKLDAAISDALKNPDFCRMTREKQAELIRYRTGRESNGVITNRYSVGRIEKRITYIKKHPKP